MEKRFKKSKVKSKPKIIVITGAESTGKSTLTELLASHFNVPFIPEIAREYVENLEHKYNYNDVEEIAKLQINQLHKIKETDSPYIFIDTWLIVTKVWFELVFNKKPDWLIDSIKDTPIDLFLVCNTDLPWVADPVRENGGEKREMLQRLYIDTFDKFNYKYKIVRGKNEQRLINAIQFINDLN